MRRLYGLGMIFVLIICTYGINFYSAKGSFNLLGPSDFSKRVPAGIGVDTYLPLDPIEASKALRIVKVWTKDHASRINVEDDPCNPHPVTKQIDDDIFWFDYDGFSTNYNEGNLALVIINPIVQIAFATRNNGKAGVAYGYYPRDVGYGRFALCVNTGDWPAAARLLISTSVFLQHQKDHLYNPENLQAFSGSRRTFLVWHLNADDTGTGAVIYRSDMSGSGEPFFTSDRNSWEDKTAECGKEYVYWVASSSSFNSFSRPHEYETFKAHSRWSDPVRVVVNSRCSGATPTSNPSGTDDPPFPSTYTPTPIGTSTPTPIPTVTQCNDTTDGAYLYSDKSYSGSCKFVGKGQTESLPFSPQSLYLQGNGVNVNLCSTSNGTQPCSEVNNNSGDLSWSSIYTKFRSAKVSDGYSSNCGGSYGIEFYSEKNFQGSCWYVTSGRYSTPFSPRSLKILKDYLGVQLCQNFDGGNPCSEYHNSNSDLSSSSIYGNFHSAVIALEEPEIGDLTVQPLGWSSDGNNFAFYAQNVGGSGLATVLVQIIQDPDLNVLRQKQYAELINSDQTLVQYSVNTTTDCFYISIDPEGDFQQDQNRSNNNALYCKDGTHTRIPSKEELLPEHSIVVGDSYVFAPNELVKVHPDYGPGWDTTAQLVIIEEHRPDGWIMATPFSTFENIHPFSEAMRVEVINNLIERCRGEGNGCREAQQFSIGEDGTVQKTVYTTLLPTPTTTPSPTLRPTFTPFPTVTPSPTLQPTLTPLPAVTPSPTLRPTFTALPTIIPTSTGVVLPTETATLTPIPIASVTVVSSTPSSTPTIGPTVAFPNSTVTPTSTPIVVMPTATATNSPNNFVYLPLVIR